MSLTLFHSPGTRSIRPRWLLEEMKIPYDLETIPYSARYFASDEYRTINPMGKVPALYDGDQLILESTVIMEYILSCYGPSPLAVPAESGEYGLYLQWLHMAESGISHYLAVILGHQSTLPRYTVTVEFDRYCKDQVEKAFTMLEETIAGHNFLLNRGFSAADISIGYTLFLAQDLCHLELPEKVSEYYIRLQGRPAFQRATRDSVT